MVQALQIAGMEEEDLATTVVTCEGDITDPAFPFKLQLLVKKLQHLISSEKKPIQVTKIEPWNSVRVTFNIPQEAAQRLKLLAERGDSVLRDLGILSVQIEGDQVITLTLAGHQFDEPKEIVIRKTNEAQDASSSVSFSFSSSEPIPGPSESSHRKINQLLGNIVGGATASSVSSVCRVDSSSLTKAERSASFPSPNVIAPSCPEPIPFLPITTASTTTLTPVNKLHVSSNTVKTVGFRPFPFASMTHAMNTKQGGCSPHYNSPTRNVLSNASASAFPVRPNSVSCMKSSQPAVNSAGSRVNVALSSPLLVNLLQSETSNIQTHNKLMPPPAASSVDQHVKRKRKPRKMRADDSPRTSFRPVSDSIGHSLSSSNISSANVPASNLNKIKPSVSDIKSQAVNQNPQGQPPLSVHAQSLATIHHQPSRQQTLPNIHPQAQGQPQVHTGNLPLHSHIPVGSPRLARPILNSPYPNTSSSCNVSSSVRFVGRNNIAKSSHNTSKKSSEPSLNETDSTIDSNPFPSPPSSGDGKTTHLINPFTGQLEPMPSDEEEEESIGSLPPFPDFEVDLPENGQSSDKSSLSKDHSSDTDSGISKSNTDTSQSSTECSVELSSFDAKSLPNATVTSSVSHGEKLKLRLKLDSKGVRELKDTEGKDRRPKECSVINQKIDVALVNISALKKSASEPRVPPLHISLRGPNAAVVVSPRKDDLKVTNKDDVSSDKLSAKKVKLPRNLKNLDPHNVTSAIPAGRSLEFDKKSKGTTRESKKNKDSSYWNQNMKNMSGGGIVEISGKEDALKYETYLPGVPTEVVSHKKSTSSDTNKSEIITLTSCSTGESVSIHTSATSPPPLPFQVVLGSEKNTTIRAEQNTAQSCVAACQESLPSCNNADKSTSALCTNENLLKSLEVSMQKHSLPHSANNTHAETKTPFSNCNPHVPLQSAVQNENVRCSTDFEMHFADAQIQSAREKNADLSEDSQNAAQDESIPVNEHENLALSTNSLPPCKDIEDKVNKVQINISNDNICTEEKEINQRLCDGKSNFSDGCLVGSKMISNDVFNSATVSNIMKHDMVLSKEVVVGNETGEKNLIVGAKKPPIAQIISVDNLPNPSSHVIEVPSLTKTMIKSDLAIELSCLPSLIPSHRGGAFLPLSLLETTQHCSKVDQQQQRESTRLPTKLSGIICDSVHGRGKNYDSGDDQCSSTFPSEESSMDSVDEERRKISSDAKECVNLIENKHLENDGAANCDRDQGNISNENLVNHLSESYSNQESEVSRKVTEVTATTSKNLILSKAGLKDVSEYSRDDSCVKSSEQKTLNIAGSPSIAVAISEPLFTSSLAVKSLPNTSDECSKGKLNPKPKLRGIEGVENESSSETVNQTVTSSSSVDSSHITSLISNSSNCTTVQSLTVQQGRLSSPEIPANRSVRLIFKNSTHSSSLSSNAPTASVVLPLNAAKTVPIKLVTVPGMATGLSVRSTSNPSVVEIIGPKAAVSSVTSNRSVHSSSPVRLVVSKVSSNVGASSAIINPPTAGVRNCVVVKSVVVTGTSSSIKLVSSTRSESMTVSSIHSSSNKCNVPSLKSEDASYPVITKTTSCVSECRTSMGSIKQERSETFPVSKVPILNCLVSPQNRKLSMQTQLPPVKLAESSADTTAAESCTSETKQLCPTASSTCLLPGNFTEIRMVSHNFQKEGAPIQKTAGLDEKLQLKEENVSSLSLKQDDPQDESNTSKNWHKTNADNNEKMEEQKNDDEKNCTVNSILVKKNNMSASISSTESVKECSQEYAQQNKLLVSSSSNLITEDISSGSSEDFSKKQLIRPLSESEKKIDNFEPEENQLAATISLVYSKPVKRKCSENASELIKACIGIDENPSKRSSLLLKSKLENDSVETTVSCDSPNQDCVRVSSRIKDVAKKVKDTGIEVLSTVKRRRYPKDGHR